MEITSRNFFRPYVYSLLFFFVLAIDFYHYHSLVSYKFLTPCFILVFLFLGVIILEKQNSRI